MRGFIIEVIWLDTVMHVHARHLAHPGIAVLAPAPTAVWRASSKPMGAGSCTCASVAWRHDSTHCEDCQKWRQSFPARGTSSCWVHPGRISAGRRPEARPPVLVIGRPSHSRCPRPPPERLDMLLPCTQIVDTLAPKCPNRDYFKAKVSTVWVHGPLGLHTRGLIPKEGI